MPEAKPPDAPAGDGGGGGQDAHPSEGSLLLDYQFRLIIDPANDAHFLSCSGPHVRVTPIPYRQGGEHQTLTYLAGPTEYSEVVCEAGMTTSPMLWNWFQKSAEGMPERRNVSLVMLGAGGAGERGRWNLIRAWPCEWRVGPYHALGRQILIAKISLIFDSLTWGGTP